jgi:hypothetical protein
VALSTSHIQTVAPDTNETGMYDVPKSLLANILSGCIYIHRQCTAVCSEKNVTYESSLIYLAICQEIKASKFIILKRLYKLYPK